MWLGYLRTFQHAESGGWTPADPAYGGWGASRQPPRLGAAPGTADLSSTLFALGALRLAGVPADDGALFRFVVAMMRYVIPPIMVIALVLGLLER